MSDESAVSHSAPGLSSLLREWFSLAEDRATPEDIDCRMRRDVVIRGTNLWVLVMAIFIASIGLNVNSTAVIIGAMLISPLMGPISGAGYGLGIGDFALIRQSLKNLLVAAGLALCTSVLYFSLTPLHVAHSELLARTTPTIWDVMIALFGGLAGAIGATRRSGSNVIPGVAIATALMPPLCTAGYGLASGNWAYFGGAFYLFTINSVFIALAAALITRMLRLPRKHFVDPRVERRVRWYVAVVALATGVPSLYLAVRLVGNEVFTARAAEFSRREFETAATHVADVNINAASKQIEVSLVGLPVNKARLAEITARLQEAGLQGASLRVFQGGEQTIDVGELRSGLLSDLYKESLASLSARDAEVQRLRRELEQVQDRSSVLAALAPEIHALYPQFVAVSVAEAPEWDAADGQAAERSLVLAGKVAKPLSAAEHERLLAWLRERTRIAAVHVFTEPAAPRHEAAERR